MKRTMIVIIVTIVVIAAAVGGVWWYISTRGVRQYERQTDAYERVARRQELEITIINQEMKLADLRKELAALKASRQATPKPVTPTPPLGPVAP